MRSGDGGCSENPQQTEYTDKQRLENEELSDDLLLTETVNLY